MIERRWHSIAEAAQYFSLPKKPCTALPPGAGCRRAHGYDSGASSDSTSWPLKRLRKNQNMNELSRVILGALIMNPALLEAAPLEGRDFDGKERQIFELISETWECSRYGADFQCSLRFQIRDRDNHTCQKCGKTSDSREFPVHHIDLNPKNNNLKNLITLCFSCHQKIHRNLNKEGGVQCGV